jgi:MAF protein
MNKGMVMKNIILASNSKARLKLLKDNGFNVQVKATNIEEVSKEKEPGKLVEDLANQKLKACLSSLEKPIDSIVLAADTMIFYKNELIGKASDKKEAYKTLKKLSNDKHQIYSSYAIYLPNKTIKSGYSYVDVYFKNLSDLTIMHYLDNNEWIGAAGSYRIQGEGSALVRQINGDFNVAVGLPLMAISDLIKLT